MTLKNWAYIFISPGFQTDTVEMTSKDCKLKIIGLDINKKEEVISLAKKLVDEGIQLIELCGGFGPTWVGKIKEATQNKIPVGTVVYGPEDRQPMLDILK